MSLCKENEYMSHPPNPSSLLEQKYAVFPSVVTNIANSSFSVFIGNIAPQSPDNLTSAGHYNSITLDWDEDGEDLNDIGNDNKWIYFALPMDLWMQGGPARAKAHYAWSPLTKDAGQMVESLNLHDIMVSVKDEVGSLQRKPWSVKKILSGFSTSSKKKI